MAALYQSLLILSFIILLHTTSTDKFMNKFARMADVPLIDNETRPERGSTIWSTLPTANLTTTPIDSHHWVKVFLTTSYSLIFGFGVPGNIILMLSIIRNRRMRNTRNIFIVNLIFGDLLNLLVCVPISATALYISWPFGDLVCKYIFPLTDVIVANTVYTILLISVERYRVIVHPMKEKITSKRAMKISMLLWLLAYLLVGMPLVFANQISEGYWVQKSCALHWINREHEVSYRIGIFVILLVIPLNLITYLFIRMRAQLLSNIRFAKTSMDRFSLEKRTIGNRKIIRVLFVIALCFAICFVPINLLLVMVTFNQTIATWPHIGTLFQVSLVLLLCHSIINPIIMFILSPEFRLAMKSQFDCANIRVETPEEHGLNKKTSDGLLSIKTASPVEEL